MKPSLRGYLDSGRLLFLDGGMGTMIQAAGESGHACPEELNLSRPGLIESIHAAYIDAGANIVETNTFGANRLKLAKSGLAGRLEEIVGSAVAIARRAAGERALVAGSVGPLGEFVEPVGRLSPGDAREIFGEVAAHFKRAGADLLLIETMSDLKEVRAAAMAARDVGLPFIVSMTFEDDGRTVLGTPPEAAVITAEALGASLTGANCSAGPEGLLPVLLRMGAVARRPLIVQPNAGLPRLEGGRTVFPATPDEFARGMRAFAAAGVAALGGCCGTTPGHIRAMAEALAGSPAAPRPANAGMLGLASRSGYVLIGPDRPVAVVGERVNPTGRRALAAELGRGEYDTARGDILGQVEAGARLLDINAGAPGLDEPAVISALVALAQKLTDAPLVIDSGTPAALEAALRNADGRVLINSVNASPESLAAVLPLAARYGAAVIALAMDETGLPADAGARLRMARRIVEAAAAHGLGPDDILVDCLALAVGSEQPQVLETLDAVARVRETLGCGTILGVSNVSFGLPAREELNAAFLAMAVRAGLDAAIVNPYAERIMTSLAAAQVIAGRDRGAAAYIERFRDAGRGASPSAATGAAVGGDPVRESVLQGDAPRLVRLVTELLDRGEDPIVINEERLVPALEEVGERFEKKSVFLPQVVGAAEAVRAAFEVIRARLPEEEGAGKGTILLASVEGDIHDLGKNILKALIENYGFRVADLGINVPADQIVERCRAGGIDLVGLSALMTTTLPAMERSIAGLKREFPSLPVVVGGAVLTPEYAARIGADGYAPDASRGVKLIRSLLGG
jgi:5-methyltetrahydrofolate--homocysteine methyltransferase